MSADAIEPFALAVPQADLDALRDRLRATRWPDRETVADWSQGAPLAAVQALCEHWAERYDWRRCETALNGLGQHRTTIDGLGIHFLHVRSPVAEALPLVLTHGWPGSVIEFMKVLGPLSDPARHGGDPADAFHLVVPSLPGYGFSDRPAATGWTVERTAAAWAELMRRLGYRRYGAQGGDWGSLVTSAMGAAAPDGLVGVHLNFVMAPPAPDDLAHLTEREQAALADMHRYSTEGHGYSAEQSTRPQTLGYGLTDSPAGQAAWIYEKFAEWTDCGGRPETVLTPDEMLDDIMLYWLPATGASSARLYWESFRKAKPVPIALPVGCSVFPREIIRPSRAWAERLYPCLVHWGEPARGGHFAAFEQPALFVEEVRATFRTLRGER